MANETIRLIYQIRALSREEKLRVLEALLTDLNSTPSEIEAEWIEVARERLQAYKEGRLTSVSYEEVISKYKK